MFWEVIALAMAAGGGEGVVPGGRRALGKFRTNSRLQEEQVGAHRAGVGCGLERGSGGGRLTLRESFGGYSGAGGGLVPTIPNIRSRRDPRSPAEVDLRQHELLSSTVGFDSVKRRKKPTHPCTCRFTSPASLQGWWVLCVSVFQRVLCSEATAAWVPALTLPHPT